jgi:guanine deaminase
MTEIQPGAKVLKGRILSFSGDPALSSDAVTFHETGAIAIGPDGRIAYCGPVADLPDAFAGWPAEDHGARILTAGFVDPHIHFPQFRMLAAPGADLLDWLERFTFPEEARFADPAHAAASAEIFLDRLIANGTTAAVAYSSVHAVSADALFAAAARRNMAIATGKTMMDRNAPEAVRDSAEASGVESSDLIARWHKRGRALYAITPRFAITSTEAQLRVAGDLLKANPSCLMQTHLSESAREIETVKRLFPNDRDYTAVYERFGLLGPTSLFGHGIHLSDDECRRLHETGSTVVHCPTSNTFLGSGLFDIDHIGRRDRAVGIGLASDVGGGTSYSMLATMGEAYKVAMLAGRRISATRLFYLATLGNAARMGLTDAVGSLAVGKFADIISLDPRATPVLAERDDLSVTLEDRLFSLAILGDDRAIESVWIAGRRWRG